VLALSDALVDGNLTGVKWQSPVRRQDVAACAAALAGERVAAGGAYLSVKY
jgi:hypothetical protein